MDRFTWRDEVHEPERRLIEWPKSNTAAFPARIDGECIACGAAGPGVVAANNGSAAHGDAEGA